MISEDDMKLFITETEELIQKTEDEIQKIENNPKDITPIQNLFFNFHTLKSMTALIGFENASKFCHYFESFLQKMKDNKLQKAIGNDFLKLLYESVDVLRLVVNKVKNRDMKDIDIKLINEMKDYFESFESDIDISYIKPIESKEISKILNDKQNKFYKVYIRLQITCVFKKVRVFIIARALNEVGKICWSNPEPDLLENGKFKGDFEIYFISYKSNVEITQILDEILEIEKKVIIELKPDEIDSLLKGINLKWQLAKEKKKNIVVQELTAEETEEDEIIEEDTEHVSKLVQDFTTDSEKITSVNVDIDKLEKLMNYFGELVILKNKINQILREKQDRTIFKIIDDMDKPFLNIQEIIFNLRLVRVESTFRKYKKLLRDIANETNKKVKFVLEGINVEIDRKILEDLNSPLIHLLRNAVYHGIEAPDIRARKNKDQTGTVKLKTYRSAGSIFIEISDDGKGIDYDKVRDILVEKEICNPAEAARLNAEALNQFILKPGFTTLQDANTISGRGMGLAIVTDKLKQLNGTLQIYSEKDVGTKFTLTVPFTRAILKAQLIKVANELFAIPIENIVKIYSFNQESVEHADGMEYYNLDSNLIPVIHLNQYLKFYTQDHSHSDSNSNSKIGILCKKDYANSAMFVVDNLESQLDVVVKPFKSNFSDSRDILGSTVLGDGSICLLLDVLTIISSILNENEYNQLNELT